MSLRLAASMGAIQTIVSMVLSFVSIKITSVYLGPTGLGTLGQLTYFIAMTQALLAAGLGTGLVRRTAELGDDHAGRKRVISTVLRVLVAVGLATSLLVAASSNWLARQVLHDDQLSGPLLLFAAVLVFGLMTTAIQSCANGAKDFRSLAVINIGSGVSSFLMIALLCPTFGLLGGLFAVAALPLASWAIAWALAQRSKWWPKRPISHGFSAKEVRLATAFVPLAIITAVGLPLLQLLIRDDLVEHSGMGAVGLLQGVMRISDMYLAVASGVFAMYFFPRFSEIRVADELLRETGRGLLIIVPVVALASIAIYLLRDWIVRLVFTVEFLPMRDLFGWQMAGNTLKMVGWLFGYVLLAKANTYALATLEIATLVVWWVLSAHFIPAEGALGATKAFAATYAMYSLATLVGVFLVLRRMGAADRLAK